MSAAQLEKNFVNTLKRRCDSIFFNNIESYSSVGFPDLVMVYQGAIRLAEAKVVHPGDWVYIRNTQIAWCYKALVKNFDTPFLLGMAGQGMGLFRFSRLLMIGGQAWKSTHKRYKLLDIAPTIVAKYHDWQQFVIYSLYT